MTVLRSNLKQVLEKKAPGKHGPTLSFKEIAEVLGLTPQKLKCLMKREDAPAAKIVTMPKRTAGQNTYYNRKEALLWIAKLKKEMQP